MMERMSRNKAIWKVAAAGMLVTLPASMVQADPIGGFAAVLDQQQNHGDSRRSVVFYDIDDMANPLFSVFTGFENGGFEDPGSLTVDSATGDVYVLAFDSPAGAPTNPPGIEVEIGDGAIDSTSDMDLYRIDFQAAYNAWDTGGQTYRTFGENAFFDATHTNPQAAGPFPIQKIAEIGRSQGDGGFFSSRLEFIDENTLVYADSQTGSTGGTTDVQIRAINKVANTSGSATASGSPLGTEGGFNNGTSESWESVLLGHVNLDPAGTGFSASTSELVNIAAVRNIDGVTGIWMIEDDGSGDDVAFFEITNFTGTAGNGLKQHAVGSGPAFPDRFTADNDPFNDSSANDGNLTEVLVNPNTGNLIFLESGFFDGTGTPGDRAGGALESGVFTREIDSYDDGTGKIDFGAWGAKVSFDATGIQDDGTFVLDGRNAIYDWVNNDVYIFDEDGGSDTANGGVAFNHDWYKLDLDTGITTAVGPDADASNGLFDSSGRANDQVEFFFLAAALTGDFDSDQDLDAADIDALFAVVGTNVPPTDAQFDVIADGVIDQNDVNEWVLNLKGTFFGDANLDGTVDLLDFDFLAQAFGGAGGWGDGDFNGDGAVTLLDFDVLAQNFGSSAPVSVVLGGQTFVIPEPATVALLGLGGLALLGRRRRQA